MAGLIGLAGLNNNGLMPKGLYVAPVKKYADFFFNSSLEYEIAFLKMGIERLYDKLSPEERETFEKFIPWTALKPFLPKQDFEIPGNSIFNEFFMR